MYVKVTKYRLCVENSFRSWISGTWLKCQFLLDVFEYLEELLVDRRPGLLIFLRRHTSIWKVCESQVQGKLKVNAYSRTTWPRLRKHVNTMPIVLRFVCWVFYTYTLNSSHIASAQLKLSLKEPRPKKNWDLSRFYMKLYSDHNGEVDHRLFCVNSFSEDIPHAWTEQGYIVCFREIEKMP